MHRTRLIAKKGLMYISILLLVGLQPSTALAEEVTTPSATSTPASTTAEQTPPSANNTSSSDQSTPTPSPAPTTPVVTGPTAPTGPESRSYTYNPDTKLWENDYFTWDPVTKLTKPKQKQTYSYNPSTNMWDTTEWRYDAPTGTYKPNVVTVSNPPSGSAVINGSSPTSSNSGNDAKMTTGNTGPESHNLLNSKDTSSSSFNLFFDGSISNTLNSTANSGNVAVLGNTNAGNATSGNADVFANIINMLQSSSNLTGSGNLVTFFSDIKGDVVGDLMIDPGLVNKLQPANNANSNSKLDVNSQVNGAINNDINLAAGSGNVTVGSNTKAGDATSGNANAVANIVNMMNSAVTSGDSFVGLLNIYGNLDGDILVPPSLLSTLLAANAAVANKSSNATDKTFTANLNDNQTINNNVNAHANSGNVNLANNTSAGNATSGNALSNVTILNLTGKQVVAKDAILVFVNVLGSWVGMIMDAPGSTAAAFGGGVSTNNTLADKTNINADTNSLINNNINIGAQSGDVDASNNTKAGNATSGNATASVNVANIMGSQLSLSDWFGILFINVFGSWNGSFGVDTAAGNKPVAPPKGQGTTQTAGSNQNNQVFSFAPKTKNKTGTGNSQAQTDVEAASVEAEQQDDSAQVAASVSGSDDSGTLSGNSNTMWIIIGASSGAMLLLLAIDQVLSRRRTAPSLTPVPHI